MNLSKIKILIYDFDGVICQSVNIKTEAFRELYKHQSKDKIEEFIVFHYEHGGVSRFKKIEHMETKILKKKKSMKDINELAMKFSESVKDKVINSDYVDGADHFIKKNSELFKQYICTGTPDDEINKIVEGKHITKYFDGVYGSPATKVEIIERILKQNKIDSDKVIFFGDALTDYKAAMITGCKFIGIKNLHTDFPKDCNLINDFKNLEIK